MSTKNQQGNTVSVKEVAEQLGLTLIQLQEILNDSGYPDPLATAIPVDVAQNLITSAAKVNEKIATQLQGDIDATQQLQNGSEAFVNASNAFDEALLRLAAARGASAGTRIGVVQILATQASATETLARYHNWATGMEAAKQAELEKSFNPESFLGDIGLPSPATHLGKLQQTMEDQAKAIQQSQDYRRKLLPQDY